MSNDLKVYVHLHGIFGSGKTTFGLTAPGPRLIIDVEGAAFKAKGGGEKVLWTDLSKAPPKVKVEGTVVAPTESEEQLDRLIEFLLVGKHDFESVVFDSLTLYQTKLKRELQVPGTKFDPDKKFDWDAWNRVLNHMLMNAEDFLRVVQPAHERPVNVCLISATDREQTFMRPLLEGQIRKRLPGLVDVHAFMKNMDDKDGVRHAVMYLNPTDLIDAKCRLWQLNEAYPKGHIIDPTLDMIVKSINQ